MRWWTSRTSTLRTIRRKIQIGGNATLNAAYPGTTMGQASQSTVTTNGVRISNGATSSGSGNAWEIDIGANAGDILLGAMTRFGGSHLLKDNVTGNTCTDNTLAAYFLGKRGQSFGDHDMQWDY